MFEESLLDSRQHAPSQSRWPMVVSIAIQASIAATVILIPLLHPEVLRRATFNPPELFAPAPPPPPPPPMRVMTHVSEASSAPAAAAAPERLVMATIHSAADLYLAAHPVEEAPPGLATGLPSMGHGLADSAGTSLLANAPSGPAVRVAGPGKPLNISRGVSAGMLISPIQPVYPRIALAAKMQGTVIVRAVISKAGVIEQANVVSGPVMLQGAALDAVRSARYRPFKLNGEPTEVDTTFQIVFRMNE